MKYVLLLTILLPACSDGNKCIDGKAAYSQGSMWVIPNNAYSCVEKTK